ncbi:hypothetical protein ACFMQL_30355 [Nonomuraea fastidiosa]|jgi:hypothetical protein|uniref:hypothetical protein n=1 Tax=Nonomuraea TaxID=83681 RepID=UPI00324DCD96
MRTPPHLPARPRHDRTDRARAEQPRRHPYGRDLPAQAAPHTTYTVQNDHVQGDPFRGRFGTPFEAAPPPEADAFVEQRLLGIREMSNQAIGSIDDLLQHTV